MRHEYFIVKTVVYVLMWQMMNGKQKMNVKQSISIITRSFFFLKKNVIIVIIWT